MRRRWGPKRQGKDVIEKVEKILAEQRTKQQILEAHVRPSELFNEELVVVLERFPEVAPKLTKAHWNTHLRSNEVARLAANYQIAKCIDLRVVNPTVVRTVLAKQPKLLKKYKWNEINLIGKEWKRLLKNNPRMRLDLPENIDELLDHQAVVVKLADDRSAAKEMA